ncbi:MAG: hypothetical protein JNK84_06925 [Phreatobacter sp.]|uniref:hypothetical protein n=1 Tax=Phreatobacter sp. TaxID=1966341 RepID=UPI001A46E0D2|nr:hypothetical protein [Phreatobacter sp.]MBL8568804.1 hypothetical protein [Phreatobacter sp.]
MTHMTFATATAGGIDALAARLGILVQYTAGAVIALGAVAGLARFMDTGLPACDGARIDRTLKTIARANGGGSVSAHREVGRTDRETGCAATVTAADGTRREITYRIFRNDAGRVRVSAAWAGQ